MGVHRTCGGPNEIKEQQPTRKPLPLLFWLRAGVGMHSTASSNGVKIWKQGYPAALKDGLRMDEVDYVADTHIASVQWAFDAPCPIVKYEWALLRLDNTVVLPFKTVCKTEVLIQTPGEPDTTKCLEPELTRPYASNDGLKLQKGSSYYSLIRATDVFNNTRVAATDGCKAKGRAILSQWGVKCRFARSSACAPHGACV